MEILVYDKSKEIGSKEQNNISKTFIISNYLQQECYISFTTFKVYIAEIFDTEIGNGRLMYIMEA